MRMMDEAIVDTRACEDFGAALALSEAGSILAVRFIFDCTDQLISAFVRVYQYANEENSWDTMSSDILQPVTAL